jgi:hypothetical protein
VYQTQPHLWTVVFLYERHVSEKWLPSRINAETGRVESAQKHLSGNQELSSPFDFGSDMAYRCDLDPEAQDWVHLLNGVK